LDCRKLDLKGGTRCLDFEAKAPRKTLGKKGVHVSRRGKIVLLGDPYVELQKPAEVNWRIMSPCKEEMVCSQNGKKEPMLKAYLAKQRSRLSSKNPEIEVADRESNGLCPGN